jgi:FlaA1/EpsC-like NDP-sugar epimerase
LQTKIRYILKHWKHIDRRITIFLHDVVAVLVAVQLSFWLYFDDHLSFFAPSFLPKQMVVFGLLCAGFFLWFQTYRKTWQRISVDHLFILAAAIGLASLVYLPLVTKFHAQHVKISKVVVLLNWAIAVSLVISSRLLYRAFTEGWRSPKRKNVPQKKSRTQSHSKT